MCTHFDIRDETLNRNLRYGTEDGEARHYVGYRIKLFTDIRYPTSESLNFCVHVHAVVHVYFHVHAT
jgi:hypothetical protein